MLETLVQGNDWLAFIESLEKDRKPDAFLSNSSSPHEYEPHLETWAKTDRPLRLPARAPLLASVRDSNSFPAHDKTVLARWLEEHEVRVELLDAGIGCCWCAYLGDDEPVCGETEEAALANLAWANGVESSGFQSRDFSHSAGNHRIAPYATAASTAARSTAIR